MLHMIRSGKQQVLHILSYIMCIFLFERYRLRGRHLPYFPLPKGHLRTMDQVSNTTETVSHKNTPSHDQDFFSHHFEGKSSGGIYCSFISADSFIEKEIFTRISVAEQVVNRLTNIWKSTTLHSKTKLKTQI